MGWSVLNRSERNLRAIRDAQYRHGVAVPHSLDQLSEDDLARLTNKLHELDLKMKYQQRCDLKIRVMFWLLAAILIIAAFRLGVRLEAAVDQWTDGVMILVRFMWLRDALEVVCLIGPVAAAGFFLHWVSEPLD
jgi:hypothetical protein